MVEGGAGKDELLRDLDLRVVTMVHEHAPSRPDRRVLL